MRDDLAQFIQSVLTAEKLLDNKKSPFLSDKRDLFIYRNM